MIFDHNKKVPSDGETDLIQRSLSGKITGSVKNVLLQHIDFKEAMLPDKEQNYIFSKYKPINAGFGLFGSSASTKLVRSQSVPSTIGPIKRSSQNSVDDLPRPKVILFPEDGVDLKWNGVRRIGPGLANQGNTCFLNSVLQVLTHTAPLFNFLLTTSHKEECLVVGYCMLCELKNHVVRVSRHSPQHGSIRPMSIIQKLSCIGKQFKFGRQEDSHEFLRYVIEGLQKSCLHGKSKLDRYSKETTAVYRMFGGYYRSQVECLRCHNKSNTYDPMLDLNLDIKETSSVVAALRKHIQPERLDGENRYQCDKCRTKTVAQKRGAVHLCPNVLTLQLKRFDYQRSFGGKISKDVHFSETLDLRPFMASKGPPVTYHLYAVLVHSGYSCNSGHYYCYVKGPNGIWYEMNDSQVSQVGIGRVLKAQAYLLFYIKSKPRQNDNAKPPQQTKEPARPKKDISPATPSNVAGRNPTEIPRPRPTKPAFTPTMISLGSKKPIKNGTSQIGTPVARRQDFVTNKPPTNGSTINGAVTTAATPLSSADTKGTTSASLDRLKSYDSSDGDDDKPKSNEARPLSNVGVPSVPESNTNKSPQLKRQESSSRNNHASTNGRLKLKIPQPTPSRHDNFKVWTPTKPSFLPRCVFQRASSKTSDSLPTSKGPDNSETAAAVQSSPLSASLPSSEVFFGPKLPPSLLQNDSHRRERTSSITSETNSVCSVSSTTGDWDVSDKGPRKEKGGHICAKERQHAGWVVKSMSPERDSLEAGSTSCEKERLLPNDKERKERGSSKHKKAKRKQKHASRNSDDDDSDQRKTKKHKKRRHSDNHEGKRSSTEEAEERSSSRKKRKRKKLKKEKARTSDEEELLSSPVKRRKTHSNNTRMSDDRDASGDQDSDNKSSKQHRKSSSSAPVKHWDEPSGRSSVTWDGSASNAENAVLRTLTTSDSMGYGNKVLTWEGDRSHVDDIGTKPPSSDYERNREWDDFYDEGKVKKVKTPKMDRSNSFREINVFQKIQNRRNDGREKKSNISFKVDSRKHFSSKDKPYSRL